MALFGRNDLVQAQQQTAQAQQGATAGSSQDQLQEVVVTGIRYSLAQSLQLKQQAVGTIDVVTAESIGKLPDKNVADALQRLPGINISSSGANEGGFDEADRVSMRGTNPSLTQTMINGHLLASGDWFVLDQTGTVGRSVSYTLLPAELVKEVRVYKSSEASLLEGGVAGTVDIITRKPLDFPKAVTLEASVGAVYATLPGTKDPQLSFLGNWLNADHTFGVMLQLFSETRHLRRDGQEMLGYNQISPTIANPNAGTPGQPATITNPIVAAHPDLANVFYPTILDDAFFEQKRQRNGGLLEAQWQPTDSLSLDLSGFSSKLEATNFNRSYSIWPLQFIGSAHESPNPGYVVQNNTLVAGTWAGLAGTNYGVYDQISRPDESASTNYGVLTADWKPVQALSFVGQVGVSMGHGRTPNQDVSETNPGIGAGGGYRLNGTTTAASWNLGNTVNTTPSPGGVPVAFGWIFGDQNMDVVDSERWGALDGTFVMNDSVFTDFKFGARYSDHDRHLWGVIGQGPNANGMNTGNYPIGNLNFPSNFGDGLGAGFPQEIWYWSPSQLAAYDSQGTNRDPVTRADWTADYGVHEKDSAVYVQADLGGDHWSGNVGVRFARTDESVAHNVAVLGAAAGTPGVITTSAFGPYQTVTADNTYNNVLPSANLKFDLTHDLIARFDAAATMARPDYSALAGAVNLVVPATAGGGVGSGSAGNPALKPVKSTNVDAGLEWYFAPKSLLSAELFYMKLKDYVTFSTINESFITFDNTHQNGFPGLYAITLPQEADGRVQGVELSYQQPFFEYWGVETNYTYADGKQTSQLAAGADDRLVGTSKNTFNVIGYFENKYFSARVAYTYRSEFFSGLDRSTAFTQGATGSIAASLDYTVNDNVDISLSGLNLNNPRLKYFATNESQPRALYRNGAQYYLNVRLKF